MSSSKRNRTLGHKPIPSRRKKTPSVRAYLMLDLHTLCADVDVRHRTRRETGQKIKSGNQKSNLMPETVQKIKNGNQKSNQMPEIARKIKNGNQKSNLMPEIVQKIKNGNQKSNQMPETAQKIKNSNQKTWRVLIDVPRGRASCAFCMKITLF